MKKKVVYTVSIIAVLAILSLCFLSVYLLSCANKDFVISSGGVNTSYYSENVTLFASDDDIDGVFTSAANNIQTFFSIGVDDKVDIMFESDPIKLYYKNVLSDDEFKEIKVNMVTGGYSFCPLYKNDDGTINEESWTMVIADYGIQKRVICFGFYNKDWSYNESPSQYTKSVIDENLVNSHVSFDSLGLNYPINSTKYSFTITNFEGQDIVTDGFLVEKNVDGEWCTVEKDMNSAAAQKLPSQIKLNGVTLKSGQSRTVNINVPLYMLFDEDDRQHIISGDYRYAVAYTVDGEKHYAVSSTFSIGFDPLISIE